MEHDGNDGENIMSKEVETFANEMTKRASECARVVMCVVQCIVCVWREWNVMNTLLMIHSFHATQLTTMKGNAIYANIFSFIFFATHTHSKSINNNFVCVDNFFADLWII